MCLDGENDVMEGFGPGGWRPEGWTQPSEVSWSVRGSSGSSGGVSEGEALDYLFDASTSSPMLFAREVKPLVTAFAEGVSCSVLVYGATGAGKTYTVEGSPGQNNGTAFPPSRAWLYAVL